MSIIRLILAIETLYQLSQGIYVKLAKLNLLVWLMDHGADMYATGWWRRHSF